MTSKIGLISDVHASPEPVSHALEIFRQQSVDSIICAGDIAGYFDNLSATVQLLRDNQCRCVMGNHDQSFLQDNPDQEITDDYQFLNGLPEFLEYDIEGIRLYVVHAHPPDAQHGGIKLLNQDGDIIQDQLEYWDQVLSNFNYDVLIVGHTHQVFAEHTGGTLLLNPGSSQFNHSCMVLSLPDLEVQIFPLGDKSIVKCWNFSYLFRPGNDYPPMKQ